MVGVAVQFIYEVAKSSKHWKARPRYFIFAAVLTGYIAVVFRIMFGVSFAARDWVKVVLWVGLGIIIAVISYVEKQAKKKEALHHREDKEDLKA